MIISNNYYTVWFRDKLHCPIPPSNSSYYFVGHSWSQPHYDAIYETLCYWIHKILETSNHDDLCWNPTFCLFFLPRSSHMFWMLQTARWYSGYHLTTQIIIKGSICWTCHPLDSIQDSYTIPVSKASLANICLMDSCHDSNCIFNPFYSSFVT